MSKDNTQSKSYHAIVLLSAGLDSSYNLVKAKEEFGKVLALTFNYGQKAALREIERSANLCSYYGLDHQVLELSWFKDISQSALTKENVVPPQGLQVAIADQEISEQTARSVWVPNRNGVFLNIGAAFAESLGAHYIIPGFNKEEASTFPDNSQEFVAAMNEALSFSTKGQVEVRCYSAEMNKAEIMAAVLSLSLPLEFLWPCYLGGESICGQCESCQRFLRAREVEYANKVD